jgi:hypothetical protein
MRKRWARRRTRMKRRRRTRRMKGRWRRNDVVLV